MQHKITSENNKIQSIASLKGAAILVVVLASILGSDNVYGIYGDGYWQAMSWLFMVLTGFLCFLPFAQGQVENVGIKYIGGYYKEKLLKFYPLYFIAVLIAAAVGMFDGWQSIGRALLTVDAPGQFWYMTVLWSFFAVFPIFALIYKCLKKKMLIYSLCIIFIGLAAAVRYPSATCSEGAAVLRWYIPVFIIGMILSVLYVQLKVCIEKSVVFDLLASAAILIILLFTPLPGKLIWDIVPQGWLGSRYIFIGMLWAVFIFCVLNSRYISTLLEKSGVLRWISGISYELYLLHYIVLFEVKRFGCNTVVNGVLTMAVSLVLAVMLKRILPVILKLVKSTVGLEFIGAKTDSRKATTLKTVKVTNAAGCTLLSFLIAALSFFVIYNYEADRIFVSDRGFLKIVFFMWAAAALVLFCGIKGCVLRVKAWVKVLCGLGFPLLFFLIEEFLWNDSIPQIEKRFFFVDYLLILCLCVGLSLILKSVRLSWGIVGTLCLIWGIVNHYVLEFKGCPPLAGDFLAGSTAGTVAEQYEFWLDRSMVDAVMIYIAAMVFVAGVNFEENVLEEKLRMAAKRWLKVSVYLAGALFGCVLLIGVYRFDFREKMNVATVVWSSNETFYTEGAPLALLVSFQNLKAVKPEGYSKAYAEAILGECETTYTSENKPTVIAIMNESLADLSVLGEFVSDEYLYNYDSMSSYVMKGYVYTSVYGGGTCNSEFEFLTGSSIFNVSSGVYPYQSYNLSKAYNLAEVFKAIGYETIAFHPYYATNWNRNNVYPEMGFDEFISIEDFDDYDYINWGASDEWDYEQIIKLYEDRTEPFFLFNVTMQNHGDYASNLNGVELLDIESTYDQYEDVVNYITLVNESDKAFAELLDYFSQQDDPVIICMFGDHQPSLSSDFVDMFEDYSSIEESQKLYQTPYVIWSNYDLGISNVDKDMSLNYLGANLLGAMGVKTAYSEYLLDMQTEIPIINSVGYRTSDGVWDNSNEGNAVLRDYAILQYYELFQQDVY